MTLLVSVNLSMRKKLLKLALGRSQGISGAGVDELDDDLGRGGEICDGVVAPDGFGEREGVDVCVLGCLCYKSACSPRSRKKHNKSQSCFRRAEMETHLYIEFALRVG